MRRSYDKPLDWRLVRMVVFIQAARKAGDMQTLKTLCDIVERKMGAKAVRVVELALKQL